MEFSWYDIVGSIGVMMIIGAYFLLQLQKISSTSIPYSLLNAVGASLVLISLYFDFNFPSFIIEFFWLVISLFGIGNILFNKQK